ncbi:MAG: pentapeptide repeat-containing protein [Flavobacteriaceae bacterium]
MKTTSEHLSVLLDCAKDFWTGYGKWNDWREANSDIEIDLSNIDFTEHIKNYKSEDGSGYLRFGWYNFRHANFENSIVKGLSFSEANLSYTNFTGANLEGAFLDKANLEGSNFENANLRHTDLRESKGEFNYEGAYFGGGNGRQIIKLARMGAFDNEAWVTFRKEEDYINLKGAYLMQAGQDKFYFRFDFSNVNLEDTIFYNTNFYECDFTNTILKNADLRKSIFLDLQCSGSNFEGAQLDLANLSGSNFTNSNFKGASMVSANLTGSNFTCADLSNSNLSNSVMVTTNFNKAILSGSQVYGTSAWDLDLNDSQQTGLLISKEGKSGITVDDLEVAQFIYLLINNQKIRNVINTVTSKTVLILGRFYKERKDVLDALRETLKNHDLAPIIFDFEPSEHRDLTETVQLLANMSKFVIADLTDAKSIPQELASIIPHFPSVPIRPILMKNEMVYSMFEHWENFDSVLPIFNYENQKHLLENVVAEIINPVNNWKNKKLEKVDAKQQLEAQKKKFEELKISDPEQYRKLQELGIVS